MKFLFLLLGTGLMLSANVFAAPGYPPQGTYGNPDQYGPPQGDPNGQYPGPESYNNGSDQGGSPSNYASPSDSDAMATATDMTKKLMTLSQSRATILRNLSSKDMDGLIEKAKNLLDTTQQMIDTTMTLYTQGLPVLSDTNRSKILDDIKKSWLISSYAMGKFVQGLQELSQAIPVFDQKKQAVQQIPDPLFTQQNIS
ncbi:MAG: hypothetical protein WCG05_03620 [Alphaproteobacteria bacterium]